jgi:hypothetical protein
MVTIRPHRTWRIVQQLPEPAPNTAGESAATPAADKRRRDAEPDQEPGDAGGRRPAKSEARQRTRHLATLGQALAHARRWQLSRTSSYPVTVLMMLPNSRQCPRVTFRTYGVTRLVRDVGPAEVWFDQVVPAVQNRKTYILREPS